jgi:hypothetical protein
MKDKFSIERLERGFKQLGLLKNSGKIVNKDKEDFLSSRDNLPLIGYHFEDKGILNMIGEINGSPKTIELYENTELWQRIVDNIDDIDSFVYASKVTGLEIKTIIDHLYEQEFRGNIKKLPAMSRQLFFKSNYDELPRNKAEMIIKEVDSYVDYRLKQFEELYNLFTNKNPAEYIRSILQ